MSAKDDGRSARDGQSRGEKDPPSGNERTVLKSLGLSGGIYGAVPCAVDVKGGKVIRIRPLHFDSKYDPATFNAWKIEKNGKTFEPLKKSAPAPWSLAYKKRTYSPNRIKYPLKRVDWDPNGERNPQNRGKSKFVRVSWDEATDLIAAEIKRVHKEYGPLSILVQGDGHGECKFIHAPHGCSTLLLDKMGGFTQQVRNPDSWEGWYWGARHIWGKGLVGMMNPADNIVNDISQNSDMVVVWGGDPETTPWGFRGQLASRLLFFWSQIGLKQVYICPEVNYACAIHADKWIPVLPNTDAALQLAVIYMWVTEGTYDKDYVETHTVGFDKIKAYVLGEEDGIPKTPKWASAKCGVPTWTIKALARDWAQKTVTIGHYFAGGMARGPYAHEPARLECVILGMQGLGKPGVHQAQIAYLGMPKNISAPAASTWTCSTTWQLQRWETAYSSRTRARRWPGESSWSPRPSSKTPSRRAPWTSGAPVVTRKRQPTNTRSTHIRFPGKSGGTEIHMMWTDTPCRVTCWNCGNDVCEAMLSPKIECIVAQHPWLENDCLYADIILPTNTTLEVNDIMLNLRDGDSFQTVINMRKAIEPVGESKSDYEAVCAVAQKLGMLDDVTDGFSEANSSKGSSTAWASTSSSAGKSSRRRTTLSCRMRPTGRGIRLAGTSSTRTPSPTHCPRPPASSSSIPRAWTRRSPTTRSALPIPSGSRRASPTTSAYPASEAQAYPCW